MIRRARIEDIETVMSIFRGAIKFMRASGNFEQWSNGYPSREVILQDIESGYLYVEESGDGDISGVFAFILGNDPTYSSIEGSWLNSKPYGTIHRIASTGQPPKFSDRCFSFCFNFIENLRIDTHQDNLPMRRALDRNGFTYCGVIHLADGSPRLAYQKVVKR